MTDAEADGTFFYTPDFEILSPTSSEDIDYKNWIFNDAPIIDGTFFYAPDIDYLTTDDWYHDGTFYYAPDFDYFYRDLQANDHFFDHDSDSSPATEGSVPDTETVVDDWTHDGTFFYAPDFELLSSTGSSDDDDFIKWVFEGAAIFDGTFFYAPDIDYLITEDELEDDWTHDGTFFYAPDFEYLYAESNDYFYNHDSDSLPATEGSVTDTEAAASPPPPPETNHSKDPKPNRIEEWKTYMRQEFGEPIWNNFRMGVSVTKLPDGTVVHVGGSHEDFYDPDFMIYNDVIVFHEDEDPESTETSHSNTPEPEHAPEPDPIEPERPKFDIFSYPKDIFPPTDFHTATYIPAQNAIYIIGNCGYEADRSPGSTPVYRLEVGTWKIEKVVTRGEGPGWIRHHDADLEEEDNEIIIIADLNDAEGGSKGFGRTTRFVVVDGKVKSERVGEYKEWALNLDTLVWRVVDLEKEES